MGRIKDLFQPFRTPVTLALIAFFSFGISGCQPGDSGDETYKAKLANPDYLHRSMQQLTDVIVHDIFSPPVASRIYAYPSIAAYEVLAAQDEDFKSLAGQLNDFQAIPSSAGNSQINHEVAAIHAFLTVGKQLVFSEEKMDAFQESLYQEMLSQGIPQSVFDRSKEFGEMVAKHILDWADKDHYKETRTFPRYTFNDEPSSWKPTPPDYMAGIEPHWKSIRPFVIDSATQFVPEPPTEFDLSTSSQFMKEVMEVYEAVKGLNEEREAIAQFWDCNPYVSHHMGHVMYATKKITPGGHWIGISKIASKKAGADMMKTSETYAMVSIALADAFISCWDEKWRSILIRPETVINDHIDENWKPLLQTPPFPEYTSGHSVISSAAALTLTDIYGDNFAFIDSTEVKYGLPARSFSSFFDASEEAAISRLYGGIHYMPAIDNGGETGKRSREMGGSESPNKQSSTQIKSAEILKTPFNWGVIGLGKIARKFIDGLSVVEGANLYGVASRDLVKADQFAKEFGADKAFGAYQSLIEDPEVEAIYIATPHHLHHQLTVQCLKAGKPVLCEKPFAINAREVKEMVAASSEHQVFLMEALWSKFLPHLQRLKQMQTEGTLGEIRLITADFGFKANFNPESRLFNRELGGGALLDIGIYPVFLALFLLGKPKEIIAHGQLGVTLVDELVNISMKYDNGAMVSLNSTFLASTPIELYVYSEHGTVYIPKPWYRPNSLMWQTDSGHVEKMVFEGVHNGMEFQAAEVQQCVRAGLIESAVMPHSFSILLMETLDEIRRQIGLVYPGHDE